MNQSIALGGVGLALDLVMVKIGSLDKGLRRAKADVFAKLRGADQLCLLDRFSYQIAEVRCILDAVRAVREERAAGTVEDALNEALAVIEARAQGHRARDLHPEAITAFHAARIIRDFLRAAC